LFRLRIGRRRSVNAPLQIEKSGREFCRERRRDRVTFLFEAGIKYFAAFSRKKIVWFVSKDTISRRRHRAAVRGRASVWRFSFANRRRFDCGAGVGVMMTRLAMVGCGSAKWSVCRDFSRLIPCAAMEGR